MKELQYIFCYLNLFAIQKATFQFVDQKQSFARRGKLRAIEQQIQDQWAVNQSFSSNPDERKKIFLDFSIFYQVNGRFHLGHCFSFSKCSFIAKFKGLLHFIAQECQFGAAAKRLQRDLDILQSGQELPKACQYSSIPFFPSLGKQDLITFEPSIDWRRSFIPTDENPYFNSFIEWHLTKLKEAGYVKF